MVKDEVDIIRNWIIYNGEIFGYENLFIIDNYSKDGTFEIIEEYKDKINIYREHNYSDKGLLMKKLIDKYCSSYDIAFPIDIDEFIVYYDIASKKIIVDKTFIIDYISNLPSAYIYKANYIMSTIMHDTDYGYDDAVAICKYGNYIHYGDNAKSFFQLKNYSGPIDHGNHIHTTNYHLTNLCLVHYHCRNLIQMKKKIYNNVIGLGYPNNLHKLKEIYHKNKHCAGNHHVVNYINVLENKFTLHMQSYHPNMIELEPISNFIANLRN